MQVLFLLQSKFFFISILFIEIYVVVIIFFFLSFHSLFSFLTVSDIYKYNKPAPMRYSHTHTNTNTCAIALSIYHKPYTMCQVK